MWLVRMWVLWSQFWLPFTMHMILRKYRSVKGVVVRVVIGVQLPPFVRCKYWGGW